MGKREVGLSEGIGMLAVALCGAFAIAALRAVVARDFFAWFVAPTWELAVPSLATTYGVLMLVWLVTHKPSTSKDDDDRDAWSRVLSLLVGQAVGTGLAWCIGYAVWTWWVR